MDVLEQHRGVIGQDETFLEYDMEYKELTSRTRTEERTKEAKVRCKEKFLAYTFIYKADNDKYGKLKEELQNDYTKGNDNYPDTLIEAIQMLNKYKLPYKKQITTTTGVSFAQKGKRSRNNNK